MPTKSPEKSLIKGHHHKRMQSLQTDNGSVRDFSSYFDSGRSPERSPERIGRMPLLDYENRSPERSPTRSSTPNSHSKESGRDMPAPRHSTRSGPKAILGENTPPSATMLALQNMPTPANFDAPLSTITNSSTALARTPQTYDAISTQILGLTTIATNLQREMAQLSRRSKDNATDLISLKEATNARDEDIRKSLRELVSNLSARALEHGSDNGSRSISHQNGFGAFLLDNKPHASPPSMRKNFSLPRIPSPNSFAATMERELSNSPSPYGVEGAASLAMLEKIIREMGTKEGQERILSTLSEMMDKPGALVSDTTVTTKKLEEILDFIKEIPSSRALVRGTAGGNGGGDQPPESHVSFELPRSGPLTRTTRDVTPHMNPIPTNSGEKPYSSPRAADFVSDDILKLLRRMKDSITEGGGLTAEIKALVRELRGEVLGMGREIGRKLEQVESARSHDNLSDETHGPGRDEIARIVEEGLAELKEHMDRVMHEKRRQSSSSSISRSTIDGQEIYNAVKSALGEMPLQQQVAVRAAGTGIEKEEILAAVREAWETYKPEIELQNFGLERDEILQCLREGLEQYQAKGDGGASYGEVLDAVKEGLQHFTPPALETEATITKEEILVSVRECLETFQFPIAAHQSTREHEITREDVLDAVKEGLCSHNPVHKDMEFNRQDLFDAVAAGLEGAPPPMAGVGEQILEKMHDLIEGMRVEFKQYSAANGRDTEQVLDAMKDGLEVLRADIETYVDRAADVTGKDEIIETVRNGLDHLRGDLEGSIADIPRPAESNGSAELLDAMEKEFEHLRQTIATSMVRSESSTDVTGKDEIIETVRNGLDHLRGDLEGSIADIPRPAESNGSAEILDAMEKEFEHLRQTIATSMVRSESSTDNDEVLDTIREGFESLRGEVPRDVDGAETDRTIHTMKEEFEHLRETLATTLVRGGASADKDEIIGTLQEGLDAIRADVVRIPDQVRNDNSNADELMDALNDGLDTLRADIQKMVNKPLDMTVNYEILDTLKDGLAGVRADIDRLQASKTESDEITTNRNSAVVIADDSLRRNDIENLEVLIAQLRIKVEALDSMPPPPPPAEPAPQPAEDGLMREEVERIEAMLVEVQAAVALIAARNHEGGDESVKKQDTDAIETLLHNMKAKIDEIVVTEPEGMARAGHLEAVEAMVKDTRDSLDDLAARIDTTSASKADVITLESLLREIHGHLGEMREKAASGDEGERITRTDIEAIEMICMDTKTHIEDLILPDLETLPTKTDLAELGGLVKEFHDKMSAEAELTAQAFEARKIEHGGIADKVEDVRVMLDQIRDELKSRLDESGHGVDEIAKTLESLGETVAANDITTGVKELMEVIIREFDRAHGDAEGARLESEDRHAIILEKHDGHRAAIVVDLASKIDERFNEIVMRYEDAQVVAKEQAAELGEKTAEQVDALNGTKAITEDLKALIDTLGITVTESYEKLSEDSKTVFSRVDDTHNKLEEIHTEAKAEHQQTRGEISKTLTAVEGVQAHVTEYQPQILSSIKDVLSIVGHHYEHSQKSAEELKTTVAAIPSSLPLPAITAPPPPPEMIRDEPLPEPYDDAEVHVKLDKLVDHATEAGKSLAQIDLLDQIHQQVMSTAHEVSTFVATQTQLITRDHSTKAREADEAAIALEKRLAQKERVEAEVVGLNEEKESLRHAVAKLLREKEELATQKMKLAADVSSLETALHIRREELHLMETRAEGLERRILEGVLDHSRSLLISRPTSTKGMNIKRVASAAGTNATTTTARNSTTGTGTAVGTGPGPGSVASSAVAMALKRRHPHTHPHPHSSDNQHHNHSRSNNGSRHGPDGKSRVSDRRILSLSQITGNRAPTSNTHMTLAPHSSGMGNLKRSHSVKSSFPTALRKSSWSAGAGTYGRQDASVVADGDMDKENSILDEEEEEDEGMVDREGEDEGDNGSATGSGSGSETGTERRTSYSGTCTDTYTGTGSYGPGSTVTGSPERDSERGRDSYGASTTGTVGADLDEEDSFVDDGEGDEGGMVVFGHSHGHGHGQGYEKASDSGIGTDVPTAALEVGEKGEGDYFRR